MESANKGVEAVEAMKLHKQGYTNKEIAELMGQPIKSIDYLLRKARNPRIHEIQGHYKKIITSLDEDISIRGKYMSITIKSFLSNITLSPSEFLKNFQNNKTRTYNLVEFLYHNIWFARIKIWSSDKCMVDSDGIQHKLIGGDSVSHAEWRNGSDIKEVCFPEPERTLESKAKTKGWWWLQTLENGILPHRFILQFDIFKPGDTDGYVQDHETLEIEFSKPSLMSELATASLAALKKGTIGQRL